MDKHGVSPAPRPGRRLSSKCQSNLQASTGVIGYKSNLQGEIIDQREPLS